MQEVKCCLDCNKMSLMDINQGYCESCLPVLPKPKGIKMKWHKYPEEKHLLNDGQNYKVVYKHKKEQFQATGRFLVEIDGWFPCSDVTHFAPLDPMPEDDDIDEDFKELEKAFIIWQKFPLNSHDDPLLIKLYRFLEKKFKVKK